jgi:hypothetical protein
LLAEPFAAGTRPVPEHNLRRVAGVLAELVFDARDAVARRRGRHYAPMPFLPADLSVAAITIAMSPFWAFVLDA